MKYTLANEQCLPASPGSTGFRWWRWLLGPLQGHPRILGCLAPSGLQHSSEFVFLLELKSNHSKRLGFFPCIKTVLRLFCRFHNRWCDGRASVSSHLLFDKQYFFPYVIKQKGPNLQHLSEGNLTIPSKTQWGRKHVRGSLWENRGAYCRNLYCWQYSEGLQYSLLAYEIINTDKQKLFFLGVCASKRYPFRHLL